MLWQPERRRADPETSDDEPTDLATNAEDQSLQAAPTAADQVTSQTEKHANAGIPTGEQVVSPSTENSNLVGSTTEAKEDSDSGPSTSASPSG